MEAKARERFPEYYEFILCMARTGMRIGETIALQWPDIDFGHRRIAIQRNMPIHRQVTSPKTEKSIRDVDMSMQLREALMDLKRRRKEEWLKEGQSEIPEWVFCTSEGNPIDYANFLKKWNRIQEMAGVRRRTPHALRHTYATILISAGESLAYVKDQLGHSSIQVTVDVYTKWIPGSNRQAVDQLDEKTQMKRKRAGDGK